jgi:hypothetical protein
VTKPFFPMDEMLLIFLKACPTYHEMFLTGSNLSTDRIISYGDHFHAGDIVGVLLDMNRGRLSFFLDGMKYGEHTIADLGNVFDHLQL